jgi:hypothetical protein
VLFTTIFNVVILVFCWLSGEVRWRTKIVLTLLSVAVWGLVLWSPAAVIVGQCVLIAIIGVATFGIDFLNRRVR